jgi:hypothetical protein
MNVNRLLDPTVECDLQITLMLVKYPGVEVVVLTFGQLSRS